MQVYDMPDERGHFGPYGGIFVAETLIEALEELRVMYERYRRDPDFLAEFAHDLKHFVGRPSPIYYAERLSDSIGGARIYLKREDLNHTGAHKVNNTVGQALLAKRMGKARLIAETGAGQHGVAVATVAAKLGFECTIYMGAVDVRRQRPNVFLMERLGATVVPVETGSKTLKDAVNAAIKDWIARSDDTYYLLGSALGPHPYPAMVRYFQSVIGNEIAQQLHEAEGRLPDYVIACVGGGSNAIGAFSRFVDESPVQLIGVEAGGRGASPGEHARRFPSGKTGIVQGYKSVFLQDDDGQLQPTHSISAGLDYPGIGPELAHLQQQGRIRNESASDDEVVAAVDTLAKTEGIIPALESAHAVAFALKFAKTLPKDKIVVVNLSGRGDKDLFILASAFKDKNFYQFLREEVERNA